jgi:D-alanyl-D-alanine dipeptidase
MNAGRPIPEILEARPVETVLIRECGELLVGVPDHGRVRSTGVYYARGLPDSSATIAVRRGVLERLTAAADSLPTGSNLLVLDGVRSIALQRHLVELALACGTAAQSATEPADRYVAAVPSSDEALKATPPPHSTGGAVDVTLVDDEGMPLDLGAGFDEFRERAWTRHYEIARDGLGRRRGTLRRMLYWTMIEHGFAPYRWEYWHYELGTQRAAAFDGHKYARYGLLGAHERTAPR